MSSLPEKKMKKIYSNLIKKGVLQFSYRSSIKDKKKTKNTKIIFGQFITKVSLSFNLLGSKGP